MKKEQVKQEEQTEHENVDFVKLVDQPEWKTILLDLVKKEKMNVWNIDVSLLATKYLEKIQQMQSINLKVPANAFLCCAILVRSKAKTLKFSSIEEEKEPEISEQEKLELEGMLPELASTTRIREGKVSLDELVENIESIIEKTKTKAQRERERNEKPDFDVQLIEEDIDEKMKTVFEKIQKRKDSQGMVLFSQLLDEHTVLEIVYTFLPLLFLANENKIIMWQEKFFGEIFISLKI